LTGWQNHIYVICFFNFVNKNKKMFRKIDQARALVNITLKTWEEEERKNRISFEDVAAIDNLFSEIVIML